MKPRYVLAQAAESYYLFRDVSVSQVVYYLITRTDFWRVPC